MGEIGQYSPFCKYIFYEVMNMYSYNKKYFEKIDTIEKAYWLGFIAADGNIRKDLLRMRIELNIRDKEHLEQFKESIECNMPIKLTKKMDCESCYVDVNSKDFCSNLVNLGITPNKSLTLEINWSLIPKDLIKYVIRGYFDGDGSLNIYQGRGLDEWELSFIGTKNTLLFFQQELNINKKLFSCGKNFRFMLKSKKEILNALLYFYNDSEIFLDRKYEKVQDFFGSQRLPKDNLNG